jgi:hypothetical protein
VKLDGAGRVHSTRDEQRLTCANGRIDSPLQGLRLVISTGKDTEVCGIDGDGTRYGWLRDCAKWRRRHKGGSCENNMAAADGHGPIVPSRDLGRQCFSHGW